MAHREMSLQQSLSQISCLDNMVVTIGTFDGVHLGHQNLIESLKDQAKAKNLLTAVVTFKNHPSTVLSPSEEIRHIMSHSDRERILYAQGVDLVVGLDFTLELSKVSARDFASLLVQHLNMKGLVVGPDFAFGHRREGDIPVLMEMGDSMGFWVKAIDRVMSGSHPIKSNALRQLIASGQMEDSRAMLGRYFQLSGKVINGDGRGSKIGFPTANLEVDKKLLVPSNGVYATWAMVDNTKYQSVTNIGVRPTFGVGARTIETFIIDFDANIYNKSIQLEFVSQLRDELNFTNVSMLIDQICKDIDNAKRVLAIGKR